MSRQKRKERAKLGRGGLAPSLGITDPRLRRDYQPRLADDDEGPQGLGTDAPTTEVVSESGLTTFPVLTGEGEGSPSSGSGSSTPAAAPVTSATAIAALAATVVNAAAIATNTASAATNATGIATNASGVSTNSTGVSTNAAAIAANTAAIAANAATLTTQAATIATLTSDLATAEASLAILVAQGGGGFCVWAEENAALGNNNYEWAFGNGANTPNAGGLVMPFDTALTALSLTCGSAAANLSVHAYKNGVSIGSVSVAASRYGSTVLGSKVNFSAGDRLTFRTGTITVASGSPNVMAAWLERR